MAGRDVLGTTSKLDNKRNIKKQLTLLLQGGEWPRNIQHPPKKNSSQNVDSPGASDSPGRRFTDGGPQSHGPPHGLAPQGAVPTSHVAVAKKKTRWQVPKMEALTYVSSM